jgi:Holliday junction resolvase
MARRPPSISTQEECILKEYIDGKLTAKQICAKRNVPRGRFNTIARHVLGSEVYLRIEQERKPKQTPYKLGRSLEYSVANAFRKAGFWTIRAAQSRGEADIVAIRDGEVSLIQCKRGGSISSDEWNQLYLLATKLRANAIVADRRTGRGVNYLLLTGLYGDPDSYIEYTPI